MLPTEKQIDAISSFIDYKNILLTGGVRSGKTYSLIFGLPLFVKMHAGHNCIISAKTLSNVERNMLGPARALYGHKNVGQIYKRDGLNVKIFGKEFWVITFNDESSKNRLQGLSIGLAILDEIVLCPKSFYEMLRTRLDQPFSQLVGTCNPDSPNHYIKTDLIDNEYIKSKFIQHWTLYDNSEHLPAEVIEDFENAFRRSPTFFRRMILGEWCGSEGLACFNFDKEKHFVSLDEMTDKGYMRSVVRNAHTLIYSIDPANANDMTAGVPALFTYDDRVYILRRFAHNPKTSRPLSNVEQLSHIKKHIEGLFVCDRVPIREIDGLQKIMLVDAAGADMYIQCYNEFTSKGWHVIKMTKKDIKQTLEIMNNIFNKNKCFLLDYSDGGVYDYELKERTFKEPLVDELQSVRVMDIKTALTTRIGLNPEDPNDSFDALRYLIAYYFKVADLEEEI